MDGHTDRKRKRKFRYSLAATIILGVLILIAVMEVGSATIGYIVFSNIIEKQYVDNTNMIANTAANFVNVDELENYLVTLEKDEAYLYTEEVLQTIADNEECAVIYVAQVDKENMQRHYIYDVVSEEGGLTQYEMGYTNSIKTAFLETYIDMENGEQGLKNYVYGNDPDIGAYTTTILPLKDSNENTVAVLGVVKQMNRLEAGRKSFLTQILIWALFLQLLSGSILIYGLRHRIVVPLRKIADETERYSRTTEKNGHSLQESIQVNNEIGELAASVDKMEEMLDENIKKLLDITAEKNRISTELEIATKIQENALPTIGESFPGRREMDVYAVMNPAKAVGGDFYDCFFVDSDHFAMVIADVSGKGVPAALFMMASKLLIKSTTLEHSDPGEILTLVNQKLCENNAMDMFVTVWLGILDLRTGEIRASNAGHEYPMVSDANGHFTVMKDKHGMVLGGLDMAKYKTYTFRLQPGEGLFVYTDGLAEAMNQSQEQFGLERIVDTLSQTKSNDARSLVEETVHQAEIFAENTEQYDDTTILCLIYRGLKCDD